MLALTALSPLPSYPSDRRNIELTGFYVLLSLSTLRAISIPLLISVPPVALIDDIALLI